MHVFTHLNHNRLLDEQSGCGLDTREDVLFEFGTMISKSSL